jgi:hypothetical protein
MRKIKKISLLARSSDNDEMYLEFSTGNEGVYIMYREVRYRLYRNVVKIRTFMGVIPPPRGLPPDAITPGKVITALSLCRGGPGGQALSPPSKHVSF